MCLYAALSWVPSSRYLCRARLLCACLRLQSLIVAMVAIYLVKILKKKVRSRACRHRHACTRAAFTCCPTRVLALWQRMACRRGRRELLLCSITRQQ
jgi:hypothetical protein